jgi:hypothetical protein
MTTALTYKNSLTHTLILVFSWIIMGAYAQGEALSDKAIVSVITCGPGTELYSSFGHSAFRVQDSARGIDWIYNYGTFDFNTPNFYSKFARGKLLYALSKQRFENFLYVYQLENRWVKEQILDLSSKEKSVLFGFLERNHEPENRFYKYDFLFENCSTKIPEVLQDVLGDDLKYNSFPEETPYTFRELIHQNLLTNSWSSFGIDLALGAVIDKKATPLQYMFLPNYVLRQLDNTSLTGKSLVTRERTILDFKNVNRGNFFTTSPLFWLSILLLFTATITYIDYKNNVRSRFLDIFLFSMTGLVGLLVCFLWFLTDHQATAMNMNILWAFPLNIVFAIGVIRNGKIADWIPKYVIILLGLLMLMILLWLFRFQQFSPLLIVLLITLGIRYTFLLYHFKKMKGSGS